MFYLLSLVELALRALLLGAAGMLTAWIARRRGAEVRHTIWAVVLAGMLALPLLTAMLPRVGVLPNRVVPIVLTPVPNMAPEVAPSAPGYGRIPNGAVVPPPLHRDIAWPALLFATYCAGAVLGLLRTAMALRRTGRAVRKSVPVRDAGARALLENIAAGLGLGYPLPELRESGSVSVPFTAGWFEPVIVLPAGWRTWNQFKLQSALAHELAHVRRKDWVTSVAAAVNRAVFWYHPLAWWLERTLTALAEEACDSAAIVSTGDERRYAGVLLEFATTGAWPRMWAATSVAHPSRVGSRIRRILDGRVVPGHAVTSVTWAVMVAIALPVVYGAAALQLKGTAPKQVAAQPASAQEDRAAYLTILGEGWQLTPEGAARLEADLAGNPHDVSARTRLISYYHQRMIAEPRTRHILWLIEHHPEANVFRVASGVTDMISPNWTGLTTREGHERAMELWRQHTERHPANVRILRNAINALFDPETKLRLLGQARATEPANPEWIVWMASVYTRAVRDVFFAREPGDGQRSFMSTPRQRAVGRFEFGMPLPQAEKLKAELETSPDAALVGETGELLVEQAAQFEQVAQFKTPELVQSAAFGRGLLERARALEPANPRWRKP